MSQPDQKQMGSCGRDTHALKCFLDRHLLRVNEALDRDGDGQVNVVGTDIFAQGHPRACLRHADHALQMPHSDREGARCGRFAPQVREESGEFL